VEHISTFEELDDFMTKLHDCPFDFDQTSFDKMSGLDIVVINHSEPGLHRIWSKIWGGIKTVVGGITASIALSQIYYHRYDVWMQRQADGLLRRGAENSIIRGQTVTLRDGRTFKTPDMMIAIPAVGGLQTVEEAETIAFGHGARHLVGTGLSQAEVEEAIRLQVKDIAQGAPTGSFYGRVAVGGRLIEYRAFTLPNGTINVGTYNIFHRGTDMSWRKITAAERSLIDRILSFRPSEVGGTSFDVEDHVKELDREGSLEFVRDLESQHREQSKFPVEAQYQDKDGMWIHALLFVVDKKVDELEIYKDDSSPITQMPKPEEWEILDLG